MSKPRTEEQKQHRLMQRRTAQRRKYERIRRGEEPDYLCYTCKATPVYKIGGWCKQCYLNSKRKATGRPTYICRVCQTAPVTAKGVRCRACYLKQEAELVPEHAPTHKKAGKTFYQVMVHDAEIQHARSAVRRELEPERYMTIAPGEHWLKQPKCRGCQKHIMYAGTCYTCSTGKERTVLRAEERIEG